MAGPAETSGGYRFLDYARFGAPLKLAF